MAISICWQPALLTSDLGRIVHYAGLWGVDGVELRTLGRHRERVPHVNVAAVRRRVEDEELDVISVDPGFFACSAEERAVWLNDLQELPNVVRFCTRVSATTIVMGGLGATGAVPSAPFNDALRLVGNVPDVRMMVMDTPAEGQVADLVSHVGSARLQRAATTSLVDPVVSGNMAHVGMIRCSSDFENVPDELVLRDIWSSFLAEKIAAGFEGDIVFEFTSNAEPGKVGLRVATALIKAAAAAAAGKNH